MPRSLLDLVLLVMALIILVPFVIVFASWVGDRIGP
jgi:hypothetical protein